MAVVRITFTDEYTGEEIRAVLFPIDEYPADEIAQYAVDAIEAQGWAIREAK